MLNHKSNDIEKDLGSGLRVRSYPFFSFKIIVRISAGTFSAIIKEKEEIAIYSEELSSCKHNAQR